MWNLSEGTADVTVLITPYLPFLGVIAGALLVGIFSIWNRRRGAVETRAPDVNEIWVQQAAESAELDRERKWRRKLQNFAWDLLSVFHGYVNRVQAGGSTTLTSRELRFYESEPPSTDNIQKP